MNKITRKQLLGAALLGTFALAPLATPTAQAYPPNRAHDKRERYDRTRYDNDRDYRDRYDRNNQTNSATFTGRVTNVRSGSNFDLSANGRTYTVYTVSSLPRGLSRGDEVRVYGRPYGDDDIRRANVSILDNNRRDPQRDDRYDNGDNNGYRNDYRSYTGIVTEVRNDREFNVGVGGATYNVYTTASTLDLDRGDTVRVYGQRYGVNNIRNANVTIVRNDGDNNTYGFYRTYFGVVTNLRNDREFDVLIGGTTYNVYASSGTSGLNNGDEVRIYGQRFGDNDIRNSNVIITRNR